MLHTEAQAAKLRRKTPLKSLRQPKTLSQRNRRKNPHPKLQKQKRRKRKPTVDLEGGIWNVEFSRWEATLRISGLFFGLVFVGRFSVRCNICRRRQDYVAVAAFADRFGRYAEFICDFVHSSAIGSVHRTKFHLLARLFDVHDPFFG